MSERIGVAQLSFWFPHADGFCASASGRSDVELVAVWDSDAERGRERAKVHGAPFESDLERLLARDDVDAVSICAEPFRQPELVEAAAAAGKDIVIEKAMAGDLDGAARIVTAVQRHGVRLFPTFNLRWQPSALMVKDLVETGAVGAVNRVRRLHGHYNYAEDAGFDYDMVRQREGWGDAVIEQRQSLFYVASHVTLWMVWMFGVPDSVMSMGTTAMESMPVEDNAVSLFRYPPRGDGPFRNGFIATMESSETIAASQVATEIYGNDGTILHGRGSLPSTRVWNPSPTNVAVFDRARCAWRYPAVAPHFVRHEAFYSGFGVFMNHLSADDPFPVNEIDGYHSIAMLVAAKESMASGREVAIERWGS